MTKNLALAEAVERHRANEGGFRFETSAQLAEVEEERIRLEKERRVSTNVFFAQNKFGVMSVK